MSLQMQSKFDEKKEKWEITAMGEVDISTARQLRETLDSVYQEKRADIMLLMDELSYMDSTGLGVIIGAFGRMQENKNRITLINPKDNIRKLLSITSLDKLLCSEN